MHVVLLLLLMMTMMMLFSLQLLLPKSEERGSDDAHMDVLLFSKQRNSYKSVVL